uniref:Uncharacterized protein n=1 Tax=Rhizophora mucronata TaxID=61149 RepID=A0A2P2PMN3_RHIMU
MKKGPCFELKRSHIKMTTKIHAQELKTTPNKTLDGAVVSKHFLLVDF